MAETEIPDEAAEAGAVVLREWTGGAWPADAAVRSVLAAALPFLTAERDAEIARLRVEVAALSHDLVYRLAAADRDWCVEIGDTPAAPQYIHYLAEHVTAPRPDTAPSVREPRVWRSDADPEPEDTPTVKDSMGDVWTNDPRLWVTPDTQPMTWARIAKKYGPLTEVLPVSTPGGES